METIVEKSISVTRAQYGWSKYGGARHGLVRHSGDWYCQACGKKQPDELPAYMFCLDVGEYREFIRLCASCQNIVKNKGIESLQELVKEVDVANQNEK